MLVGGVDQHGLAGRASIARRTRCCRTGRPRPGGPRRRRSDQWSVWSCPRLRLPCGAQGCVVTAVSTTSRPRPRATADLGRSKVTNRTGRGRRSAAARWMASIEPHRLVAGRARPPGRGTAGRPARRGVVPVGAERPARSARRASSVRRSIRPGAPRSAPAPRRTTPSSAPSRRARRRAGARRSATSAACRAQRHRVEHRRQGRRAAPRQGAVDPDARPDRRPGSGGGRCGAAGSGRAAPAATSRRCRAAASSSGAELGDRACRGR